MTEKTVEAAANGVKSGCPAVRRDIFRRAPGRAHSLRGASGF